mmetsp:Transcript_36449/g.83140  ORF Transcript_36449/g.83140 Transcript_36449/m.83140 type:complete len:406 (-) Transcript_36449:1796-3013(-)
MPLLLVELGEEELALPRRTLRAVKEAVPALPLRERSLVVVVRAAEHERRRKCGAPCGLAVGELVDGSRLAPGHVDVSVEVVAQLFLVAREIPLFLDGLVPSRSSVVLPRLLVDVDPEHLCCTLQGAVHAVAGIFVRRGVRAGHENVPHRSAGGPAFVVLLLSPLDACTLGRQAVVVGRYRVTDPGDVVPGLHALFEPRVVERPEGVFDELFCQRLKATADFSDRRKFRHVLVVGIHQAEDSEPAVDLVRLSHEPCRVSPVASVVHPVPAPVRPDELQLEVLLHVLEGEEFGAHLDALLPEADYGSPQRELFRFPPLRPLRGALSLLPRPLQLDHLGVEPHEADDVLLDCGELGELDPVRVPEVDAVLERKLGAFVLRNGLGTVAADHGGKLLRHDLRQLGQLALP